MCRLFGFRSAASERVHDALVLERNSLRQQSLEHPDGWGIASWQDGGLPQVARGLGAAHLDPEFERVSSAVQARTVLAHLRLASVGSVKLDNAHPFTHGRWAFAHNGTLHGFDRHRAAIEALIAPALPNLPRRHRLRALLRAVPHPPRVARRSGRDTLAEGRPVGAGDRGRRGGADHRRRRGHRQALGDELPRHRGRPARRHPPRPHAVLRRRVRRERSTPGAPRLRHPAVRARGRQRGAARVRTSGTRSPRTASLASTGT